MDTNQGSLAPQCTVHPKHATRASLPGVAISCPYDTRFYDVMGSAHFLHLPFLDFVGLIRRDRVKQLTLVIKQTFYFTKYETPKVTLYYFEYSMNIVCKYKKKKKKKVHFLFINIFRKYLFCVQLYRKWAR